MLDRDVTPDIGSDLYQAADQLSSALRTIRLTFTGWNRQDIEDAIGRLDADAPRHPEDPDFRKAEALLRTALIEAQRQKIARSEARIDLAIGRGETAWRVFCAIAGERIIDFDVPSYAEARTFADRLWRVLVLIGRAGRYDRSADQDDWSAENAGWDAPIPLATLPEGADDWDPFECDDAADGDRN
jgi:hypothetical protein